MQAINTWVVLCGGANDYETYAAPDAFGPFDRKDDAMTYLLGKHYPCVAFPDDSGYEDHNGHHEIVQVFR